MHMIAEEYEIDRSFRDPFRACQSSTETRDGIQRTIHDHLAERPEGHL